MSDDDYQTSASMICDPLSTCASALQEICSTHLVSTSRTFVAVTSAAEALEEVAAADYTEVSSAPLSLAAVNIKIDDAAAEVAALFADDLEGIRAALQNSATVTRLEPAVLRGSVTVTGPEPSFVVQHG